MTADWLEVPLVVMQRQLEVGQALESSLELYDSMYNRVRQVDAVHLPADGGSELYRLTPLSV